MSVKYFTVEESFDGLRLDRWFKRYYPKLKHNSLEKLARTGQIRVDGSRVTLGYRLLSGQRIRVPPLPIPKSSTISSLKANVSYKKEADLRQRILYHDKDILVIDKPSGLPVQGGSKVQENLDEMLESLRFDSPERPRLVHRLDKDTGGVLVIARTTVAAKILTEMFRDRQIRKLYWALVVGEPKNVEGRISFNLIKRPVEKLGERVVVDSSGQESVSLYRKIFFRQGYSWLALMPLTGRTHQLRVHCAFSKIPIVGDKKYGIKKHSLGFLKNSTMLQLFARAIELPNFNGRNLRVAAPLPSHMKNNFDSLGFDSEDKDADDMNYFSKFVM